MWDFQQMNQEALDDYKERGRVFWENIDVDKYKPVLHGPEPTAEEVAAREALALKIQTFLYARAKMSEDENKDANSLCEQERTETSS